jgi:hypothetical protein
MKKQPNWHVIFINDIRYGTGTSFLLTAFEVVKLAKVPLIVSTVPYCGSISMVQAFRPNLVKSQVGKKSIFKIKVGPGRIK